MNVAYLLGSLQRGGTETLLLDYFKNSAIAGYSFIGIHRKGGHLLDEFKASSTRLYHLGVNNKIDINYLLRLRKILKKENIQIVHAQQPIDALLARIAVLGSGIRIVVTIHGFDFEEGLFGKIIKWIALRCTDLNIYVSNTQMDYYVDKFKLKNKYRQKVIYNGISFEKFDRSPNLSVRKEFGIKNNTLLLCSIGNFVPGRDQMTICRFLVLLKKLNIDFMMIFAGARALSAPRLFDNCVAFCRMEGLTDNVIFAGSRSDVPEILAQSDAFIYSSDYDTFGIAVIEAISVGIPVFVNDWEVMKEVTEGGKHATLYKTKDELNLFNIFMLYLKNKELYKRKSKINAIWARETFSVKNHLISLNNAYSNLI